MRPFSRRGPSVGMFMTMATMVAEDMRLGNTQPMELTSGLMAMRTGYFRMSFHSSRPLARAVVT
jgi:hypothetical protein